MKILISSHAFHPSIGGLETVVSMLAHQFVELGHEVVLITQTPSTAPADFPFQVVRRPKRRKLIRLIQWSDIYFQNNMTLRLLWPLLIVRRPWVVAHHGWYARPDGRMVLQDRIKRFLVRFATSVSVSNAVANQLSERSEVIPNPYRDDLFKILADTKRERQVAFLGRLVPDKGADLLLQSVVELRHRGILVDLTIIGGGPEDSILKKYCVDHALTDQVRFAGLMTGESLARELNRHQILVVPSRLNEPFGVVALEGIACGCIVIGSEGGGLKDAIGPCGVTFPNNDLMKLADELERLIRASDEQKTAYRSRSSDHLANHKADQVAVRYLEVLQQAFERRRSNTQFI